MIVRSLPRADVYVKILLDFRFSMFMLRGPRHGSFHRPLLVGLIAQARQQVGSGALIVADRAGVLA